MKTLIIIVVVVIILGISGFILLNNNKAPEGNSQTTSETPTPIVNTSAKAEISIISMSFPEVIAINKGQSIVWTNNDTVTHTVSFNEIDIDSGSLSPGATFTQQFDQVGSFTYTCKFHPEMKGKIIVI